MVLTLILFLLRIFLSLFSIVFGVILLFRCSGKLKTAIVFLMVSSVILFIEGISDVINFTGSTIGINNLAINLFDNAVQREIFLLLIAFFIFLSLVSIKSMVNEIDNNKK